MATRVVQQKLDGSYQVATGNRIKDQLAAIMEAEPETQADEDYLAAVWLWEYGGLKQMCGSLGLDGHLSRWNILRLAMFIVRNYRTPDIRRRRQEMAADGSYPWPTDEAERRQKRAKGGAPG